MASAPTNEPEHAPGDGPGPEPRLGEQLDALLETRLARRIVAVTLGGMLILGALAWWVFVMPYESGGPTSITCGATLDVVEGPVGEQMLARYEEGCDRAEASRRNTALVIAAVVVVAAATVTTWPSGRLTDGPDGSGRAAGTAGTDGAEDDPTGASELVRRGLLTPDGRPLAEGEAPPVPAAAPTPTGPELDPELFDGPAGELIRLGLIDPADVVAPPSGGGAGEGAGGATDQGP